MRAAIPHRRALFLVVGLVIACLPAALVADGPSGDEPPPLLVLLAETGERRGELPVVEVREAPEVAKALGRGLSGELLRVYRWVQIYRQALEGTPVEPAYVLLSDRQGGFARQGFVLGGEPKPEAGYVDVHRDWPPTGKFGALDQIVPHELAHVIRRQLVGPLAEGGANQVHALALRTDRATAFNEGFAEHLQVMALDHPDADPATGRLAADPIPYERAVRHLDEYRRELEALVAVAPRLRMGFLAWFSNDEDVLRYHAVKANAFAREPEPPLELLERGAAYRAYLADNTQLGDPDGRRKPLARMLSSEGVVSALFHRWATDDRIRDTLRDGAFYEAFGARRDEVSPLGNVYLKLFEVFYRDKPQSAMEVIEGYRARFPDEAPFVQSVAEEVFLGQPLQVPEEIWLANPALTTGTTLFDQYRGLPRVHTFDLNAASLVDLATVPGVDVPLARDILAAGPFETLGGLERGEGVDGSILDRFRGMSTEMDELRAAAEGEHVEDVISIRKILTPYAWRALAVLVAAATAGALLFRRVRRLGDGTTPGPVRSAFAGSAAGFVGLGAGWALGGIGLASVGAVGLLFGVPAAAWRLWKSRQPRSALAVLASWVAAALPAVVLVTPWF